MIRLTVIAGPDKGWVIEPDPEQGEIIIGREETDIILADKAASRKHAQITQAEDGCMLHDFDSSNGTFVNDKQIDHDVILSHEDRIRFGATIMLFETFSGKKIPKAAPPQDIGSSVETILGFTFGDPPEARGAKHREQMAFAGLHALRISHSIKNMLQTVASGREVIDHAIKRNDVERTKRAWPILNRSLEQMNHLVVNLLKLSRDSTPEIRPCNVNELLESIVENVSPRAEVKNISIGFTPDNDLGKVKIDPDRIAEAVLNLVLNAIEAMADSGGKIEIATARDEANENVFITIADNGPGIEDVEAVFEPFHSSKKKAGTGLGLTITKRIVEQHHGQMHARNRNEGGTMFMMSLPIKRP